MTLHLRPEIAAGLETLASAQGLSVEAYLEQFIERELSLAAPEGASAEEHGMVWENGLFVYKTGQPLAAHIVTDVVRRSRDERMERILGDPA